MVDSRLNECEFGMTCEFNETTLCTYVDCCAAVNCIYLFSKRQNSEKAKIPLAFDIFLRLLWSTLTDEPHELRLGKMENVIKLTECGLYEL